MNTPDLETLTLGQLRELRARIDDVLNPRAVPVPAPDATPNPYAHLIGRPVLVRSRGSGVWAASLVSVSITPAGVIAHLDGARRFWSWTGAGECSSLALTGPTGGKIGPACSVVVSEVLEIHPMQTAALSALSKVSPWTA